MSHDIRPLMSGDWVAGMREGRGDEQSQYGQYKGAWKADTKTGYGEERTLVGTIFEGTWERNRKNGRGVRRMIFGAVDEQVGVVNMRCHQLHHNIKIAFFSIILIAQDDWCCCLSAAVLEDWAVAFRP